MKRGSKTIQQGKSLYTLEVFLIGGPITEQFVKKNPIVVRTIEILGCQTLSDLHRAIFEAFDREEEHLYEFQIGGKGPQDPKAKCYRLPEASDDTFGGKPRGDTTQTTIGSLDLKIGQAFGYWFDFGDDWWHQLNVVDIKEVAPEGQYPKVAKREGESPPQYPDL